MTSLNLLFSSSSQQLRLLDFYPNVAIAYSTRKLRRAYNGPAIRVRRSSDNSEKNISFNFNGNLNENDLLGFVGNSSAFISTWFDQSGNNRNALQTIPGSQPSIVTNGIINKMNGVAAPLFGPGYFGGFRFSSIDLTQHSVFCVNNSVSGGQAFDYRDDENGGGPTGGNPLVDDSNNGGRGYRIRDNNGNLITVFSSGISIPRLVTGIKTVNELLGYENNILQNTINFSGSIPGIVTVGIGSNGFTPGNNFSGSIPELIIYNTAQVTNRSAININIMKLYSIT